MFEDLAKLASLSEQQQQLMAQKQELAQKTEKIVRALDLHLLSDNHSSEQGEKMPDIAKLCKAIAFLSLQSKTIDADFANAYQRFEDLYKIITSPNFQNPNDKQLQRLFNTFKKIEPQNILKLKKLYNHYGDEGLLPLRFSSIDSVRDLQIKILALELSPAIRVETAYSELVSTWQALGQQLEVGSESFAAMHPGSEQTEEKDYTLVAKLGIYSDSLRQQSFIGEEKEISSPEEATNVISASSSS